MLAFGILQIILFFKIWEMTNNVKRLTNKFIIGNNRSVIGEILKGGPNVADTLFAALYMDLCSAYDDANEFAPIIDIYKKAYKKANIEFPAKMDITTHKEFRKLISLDESNN